MMRPIDADELLTAFPVDDEPLVTKSCIRITIQHMPTIEPNQGEWIEHEWAEEVEGLLISNYECSKCHSWERNASNYCPNCGARMFEEFEKENHE